ncbi:hypothetical protein O9G_006378, partial [Rozella allomycis CSF55]
QRLKQDLKIVKDELEKISSADWKLFLENKKIQIKNHLLTDQDIQVFKYQEKPFEGFDIQFDNNLALLLNTTITPSQKSEGLARDIINLFQRLRKTANLVQTDIVNMQVKILSDPSNSIATAINSHKHLFDKALKGSLSIVDAIPPNHLIKQSYTDPNIELALFK